ncbi:hypothetical protein EZS27_009048 [termite gut metagenome]|uniref:Uncharacterized protein n=1 Tax=termite gut metagenome TaxID=433724 RepID=A0A5J4SAP3_9ZZZZ
MSIVSRESVHLLDSVCAHTCDNVCTYYLLSMHSISKE